MPTTDLTLPTLTLPTLTSADAPACTHVYVPTVAFPLLPLLPSAFVAEDANYFSASEDSLTELSRSSLRGATDAVAAARAATASGQAVFWTVTGGHGLLVAVACECPLALAAAADGVTAVYGSVTAGDGAYATAQVAADTLRVAFRHLFPTADIYIYASLGDEPAEPLRVFPTGTPAPVVSLAAGVAATAKTYAAIGRADALAWLRGFLGQEFPAILRAYLG